MTIKENQNKAVTVDQQQKNLQLPSKWEQHLRISEKDNELYTSLYRDPEPTKQDLLIANQRLLAAFPRMTKEFFVLLSEFVQSEKFTRQRLMDAVNHVIANFQYKELNVADVIGFDRRVKLYDRNEMCYYIQKNSASTDHFQRVVINEQVFWVLKTDVAKARLRTIK